MAAEQPWVHRWVKPSAENPCGTLCRAQGDDLIMSVRLERVSCPECIRIMLRQGEKR